MKGAAGLVGFDTVRDLAHDLEDVLERVRKRTLAVSDVLVTLLLRSVDVLRGAVTETAGGSTTASETVLAFRRRLAEAARRRPIQAAPGAPPPPASAEHGVEEAPTPQQPAGSGRSLRVDVTKLDRMLDLSGEIAIARGRLARDARARGRVARGPARGAPRDRPPLPGSPGAHHEGPDGAHRAELPPARANRARRRDRAGEAGAPRRGGRGRRGGHRGRRVHPRPAHPHGPQRDRPRHRVAGGPARGREGADRQRSCSAPSTRRARW